MVLYHAIFGENEFFMEARNIEIEIDSIIRKCGWKDKLGTEGGKIHMQR